MEHDLLELVFDLNYQMIFSVELLLRPLTKLYLVSETHEAVNEGWRLDVPTDEVGCQGQAGDHHDGAAEAWSTKDKDSMKGVKEKPLASGLR